MKTKGCESRRHGAPLLQLKDQHPHLGDTEPQPFVATDKRSAEVVGEERFTPAGISIDNDQLTTRQDIRNNPFAIDVGLFQVFVRAEKASISPTNWSSTDASLKFVVSKSAPKLEALSPDQPQR